MPIDKRHSFQLGTCKNDLWWQRPESEGSVIRVARSSKLISITGGGDGGINNMRNVTGNTRASILYCTAPGISVSELRRTTGS